MSNMKPGDKVWVFCGDRIEAFIVTKIDENLVFGEIVHRGSTRNICIERPYPIFPTREALCEHYRKIFE